MVRQVSQDSDGLHFYDGEQTTLDSFSRRNPGSYNARLLLSISFNSEKKNSGTGNMIFKIKMVQLFGEAETEDSAF